MDANCTNTPLAGCTTAAALTCWHASCTELIECALRLIYIYKLYIYIYIYRSGNWCYKPVSVKLDDGSSSDDILTHAWVEAIELEPFVYECCPKETNYIAWRWQRLGVVEVQVDSSIPFLSAEYKKGEAAQDWVWAAAVDVASAAREACPQVLHVRVLQTWLSYP
jgi:hypothetical protein